MAVMLNARVSSYVFKIQLKFEKLKARRRPIILEYNPKYGLSICQHLYFYYIVKEKNGSLNFNKSRLQI